MRTILFFTLFAACALLFFAACGSTSNQRGSRGGNPDRINADQMEEVADQYNTAYSVIEGLRPLWLRKRGRSTTNPSEIVVYLDGSRYASPDALRSIPTVDVASMAFLSPAEATNRYGSGHIHGAILVTSKSGL